MFWFALTYSYRARDTMPVREGLWARQWECRIDLNALNMAEQKVKTMLTGNWAESHLKYCHFAQKPGIVCPVHLRMSRILQSACLSGYADVFFSCCAQHRSALLQVCRTVRVILCPFIDCSDLFSVFVCSIGPLNLCPSEHIYYCFAYCRLTFKCPLRLVCAISATLLVLTAEQTFPAQSPCRRCHLPAFTAFSTYDDILRDLRFLQLNSPKSCQFK